MSMDSSTCFLQWRMAVIKYCVHTIHLYALLLGPGVLSLFIVHQKRTHYLDIKEDLELTTSLWQESFSLNLYKLHISSSRLMALWQSLLSSPKEETVPWYAHILILCYKCTFCQIRFYLDLLPSAEFWQFSCLSDLTWNQFLWMCTFKTCYFDSFSTSEIWFLGIFAFWQS